jgi:hypothetical protein
LANSDASKATPSNGAWTLALSLSLSLSLT